MKFVINRSKLKELARFRGWKALYTPLAAATGFSVSYCRRVVLGKEKLTEYFMLQYIRAAGVNPARQSEWAPLFDVDLSGKMPTNHSPKLNLLKLNGHGIKYRYSSRMGQLRVVDDPDCEIEDLREYLKSVNATN